MAADVAEPLDAQTSADTVMSCDLFWHHHFGDNILKCPFPWWRHQME